MCQTEVLLSPQWKHRPEAFRHAWAPIGNVDQFRWLSRADLQRQLIMARDELGLRHVRAAAMYSPELGVWSHDLADWRAPRAERTLAANWQFVDLSIEALLDIGLKPIYTTCFTPLGMSNDTASCWPDGNCIGMPRCLDQWAAFVASGIRHHIARFGIQEVRSWYFECWNEPNLKGAFFNGTMEDFFSLWSATWHAVKSVDAGLRFGGPSTARGEWIPEFLEWTARDGTPPDYLVSHVYNNDSDAAPLSPFDGPASHRVKDSPHFAAGVIRGLRRELQARRFAGEVHWNEWGRSWFPCDFSKETALEPAFIVKTMAETSQCADYFGFWCLSDIYNQCGYQNREFQGNYGMLSLHGLRKQSYFAHMLLNKLGHARVEVQGGDDLTGAIATVDASPSMLIFAYPGTDHSSGDQLRIRVASSPTGLPPVQLLRLGAEENNIVAAWKSMGAPDYPTKAQLDQLRATNHLVEATSEMQVEADGVTFAMERPGVAFLRW